MFGDFSRRTFDGADGYRAVLLQQGRVVLDADVNEQAEITAHHDEVRARDLVGRHGGPAPEPHVAGEPDPGPFAIVGPHAGEPAAWGELRLTPGTYYVDGVLCEYPDDAPGGSRKLTGQPMAPRTRRADDASAPLKVNEPPGRCLAYLDVWHRTVSPDEDPSLLESALGGPDTAVRLRTTWQVRTLSLEEPKTADQGLATLSRTLPLMTAEPASTADAQARSSGVPAEAESGYRRLDNQLYRVQVHEGNDVPTGLTGPTVLWSRDNGSVVARLLDIVTLTTGVKLTVDRNGRDDDLSFAEGNLVEVTSTDLELQGECGFLATVTDQPSQDPGTGRIILPIAWKTTPGTRTLPTKVADLGLVPIVRRWDSDDALLLNDAAPSIVIDGDISATFSLPSKCKFRTGDYWLIPARTVQLAYGIAGQAGRIEWPTDGQGNARQMPPTGPDHRFAPLAILTPDKDAGKQWRVKDCRRLFAPISDVAAPALHLLGGDGQEALPGHWLPQPVRVAVRTGGSPVSRATVRFSVQSGSLALPPEGNGTPLAATATSLDVPTDDDGVAAVRWLLGASAASAGTEPPTTQVLTIRLLDAEKSPTDPPITVTGRLSVAGQVGWTAPAPGDCDGYSTSTTVEQALNQLVTAKELVLLGGDGQSAVPGIELPVPVRIAVRAGGRPLQGAAVTFETDGGHLAIGPIGPQPTLGSPPALSGVQTGATGVLSVRWLLNPGGDPAQQLTISLDGDPASLIVTGHLDHAKNVAWDPPDGCAAFSGDATVQAALRRLATTRQLRLLGGDGQEVHSAGEIAPQPVRVVVDSPCGPASGVTVFATPSSGGRAAAADPAALRPRSLPDPPQGQDPHADTGDTGEAAFWWQPGDQSPASLRIHLADNSTAPIIVGALVMARELVLLGGDGQSAVPGAELPVPVRIAVRAGGRPLQGAAVTFETDGGHLAIGPIDQEATLSSPSRLPGVQTGATGVLNVRWLLNPEGDPAQQLTISLDGDPASLIVTGHLDHAKNVAWDPPDDCAAFSGDATVQAALRRLATTRQLRLLGGDGQEVHSAGEIAPQPVRVVVDSPCGPASGVTVFATPSGSGRAAAADPAASRPKSLPDPTPDEEPHAITGDTGEAAFWWQPGGESPASLRIHLGEDRTAAIVVGASRTRGLHITAVGFDPGNFSDQKLFRNDTRISAGQLANGIYVKLDGPVDRGSWIGKPTIHVVLDLPWPKVRVAEDQRRSDGDFWSDSPVGTRSVELSGGGSDPGEHPDVLAWRPTTEAANWLQGPLWDVLSAAEVIRARFVIDGWAITGTEEPILNLNTHAVVRMVEGRADLRLPTDDEIPGGTFVQWFWLGQD